MSTTTQLADKEAELRKSATAIVDAAKAEGRKLTAEEETQFAALETQINEVRANKTALEAKLKALGQGKISEVNATAAAMGGTFVKEQRTRFSLLHAIESYVNGRPFDEDQLAVITRGRKQMQASGLSYGGQIIMPIERRTTDGVLTATHNYTASTYNGGKEAVPTDTLDIVLGLRGNTVLGSVGATLMTGLVGNIDIPTYSGSTVAWGTETANASNGTGTFGQVQMAPKRLTCFVDISKQFMIQTAEAAEQMLRRDIADALSGAVEQALFATSAVTNAPAPIALAAAATGITTAADWYGVVSALETANMYGDFRCVLSPSLKASLRGVTIDAGSGRLLFDDGYLDGYPVEVSTNMTTGYGLVGVWPELIVGQWGAADITIDQFTQAGAGKVRIVVNAYFDGVLRRAGALKLIKYVAPAA